MASPDPDQPHQPHPAPGHPPPYQPYQPYPQPQPVYAVPSPHPQTPVTNTGSAGFAFGVLALLLGGCRCSGSPGSRAASSASPSA